MSEREPPTAAVGDTQVNIQSGTEVDRLAHEMGATEVPEVGRRRRSRRGARESHLETDDDGRAFEAAPSGSAAMASAEARRTLAARREHSKGHGNFPTPSPAADLVAERPEDRAPADLPKARDPRSAPKGNVTAGQADRNPNVEVRDEFRPSLPTAPSGFERAKLAADAAAGADEPTTPRRPAARRSSAAKRQVLPASRTGGGRRALPEPGRAPRDAEKVAKRAAAERRAQARGSAAVAPSRERVSRATRTATARRAKKSRQASEEVARRRERARAAGRRQAARPARAGGREPTKPRAAAQSRSRPKAPRPPR